MLKPRALRPGDRLAVVAPASGFSRDEFDRGIEEIRALGFEPVYDERVFDRHWYLAGTAETRAAVLDSAWRDPSIAGIIAVRGGYGSGQVLPLLDKAVVRAACKPFIGYSDITMLLTFLTLQCGMVAFHGPMLDRRLSRGEAGYDRQSLLDAVSRAEPMGELAPPSLETIRRGDARGLLLGGTVTNLLASLGTSFVFDPPPGYVLFFDEVAERPYRLDRMVLQLRQTGLLERAAAVVIGELPRCDEPGGEPTARQVMAEVLSDFRGPVLFGFPSGHAEGPSITLPFGVSCRVVADQQPRLIVEESAVTR
jgi:muramoyltetrapeptide carboxypeptidase